MLVKFSIFVAISSASKPGTMTERRGGFQTRQNWPDNLASERDRLRSENDVNRASP